MQNFPYQYSLYNFVPFQFYNFDLIPNHPNLNTYQYGVLGDDPILIFN